MTEVTLLHALCRSIKSVELMINGDNTARRPRPSQTQGGVKTSSSSSSPICRCSFLILSTSWAWTGERNISLQYNASVDPLDLDFRRKKENIWIERWVDFPDEMVRREVGVSLRGQVLLSHYWSKCVYPQYRCTCFYRDAPILLMLIYFRCVVVGYVLLAESAESLINTREQHFSPNHRLQPIIGRSSKDELQKYICYISVCVVFTDTAGVVRSMLLL